MSWLSNLEKGGLSLLEDLVPVIAELAARKNPTYAPAITAAATAISTEATNIANGVAPSAHDPAIAQATAAVIAGAAQAVENNNPNASSLVQVAASAITDAANSALGAPKP